MNDPSGQMSELYDEAYFSERDFLPSHLLACLEQLLHQRQARSVLEVGVGTGRLMTELRHRGYEVEGVDNSPIAAARAGATVASATDLPFGDGVFDCVIGVHMIEHLTGAEGEQFVDEVRRVLKGHGTVFLVTPNFASPLRYLQGPRWYGYSDPTHINF